MKQIFRKLSLGILITVFGVCLFGCGVTKIPQGWEGVKVNTLGDGKGSITNVGVGWQIYPFKYNVYKFPLFKQNYVWTADRQEGSPNDESIKFQSGESMTFTADIGISYSVNKGKSAELYVMYHKGIEEITDIDMRNSVRDAFNRLASERDVEGIYGTGKTKFIEDVETEVRSYWEPIGITVHKLYLVGQFTPPESVLKSINDKIQATQKAIQIENEVRMATAEANKTIEKARGSKESMLLVAEGEAGAIALVQKQLSSSPMYIEYLKATKWDGKLPQITGGGAIPMIDLKTN